jgi:hypothetical protein
MNDDNEMVDDDDMQGTAAYVNQSGEPPTLEEYNRLMVGRTRSLTDQHPGRRAASGITVTAESHLTPEEASGRLRGTPVNGERTPAEAAAIRATKNAEAAKQKREAAKRRLVLVDEPVFDWALADELDALAS